MNFENYDPEHFFDEMFHPDGSVREHYRALFEKFQNMETDDFRRRRGEVDQSFLHRGITFTVYSDSQGTEKIFPFDIMPRVIPKKEWDHLTAGLTQRIIAINLFLKDIYTNKQILKDGIIPEHYVYSAPHYRKEFVGIKVPKDIYVHICGTDLIRDDKGEYLILEDNARCPSGVSYMLEGRQALKRAFPRMFSKSMVQSIAHYPEELLKVLQNIAPDGNPNPTIGVLTPGSYNSAYFEHCFLAQQMGVNIVEGQDLVVENQKIYMKTIYGLQKVDVLYRRIDDDFIDPQVFRKDSMLGVPGLVEAYRSGNLGLANSIGTGVADDKVMYYFIPRIIKYYLGEDPILNNVETFLASEEKDLKYILDNLPNMVVKSANESGGYGMLIGPHATKKEIEEFRTAIIKNPRNFIGQPPIQLSRHPSWTGEAFEGRHIDLRPYILYGEDVKIVPGGLTRVALKKGSLVVNSSQGGGSKDTWVLSE
jgi:uncharacterized circularly permuted ATP-grasp superfamily protein